MFYSEGKSCSALLIAAYRGYKDIAELLINGRASVHTVDGLGETSLHKSSSKGHRDIVELLIVNGAKIDAHAKDGCTPLYLAALGQHQDVAQLLLDYGAAMEPDIAVMLGDLELVKNYLEQGVDTNSLLTKGPDKGNSFLNIAVRNNKKTLVKLLLDYGAGINKISKSSPLHIAAIRGYQDICEILIARGANVNSKDKYGQIPLHRAASYGHQDIVQFLLDCGSDVNALDFSKTSPLFEAARLHHVQIVKSLLSHGAEVNWTDKDGWTPLLRAFQQSSNDEIIRILIVHGANVNIRGSRGESPLHLAVAQNNKNLVEFLLANGAQEGLA